MLRLNNRYYFLAFALFMALSLSGCGSLKLTATQTEYYKDEILDSKKTTYQLTSYSPLDTVEWTKNFDDHDTAETWFKYRGDPSKGGGPRYQNLIDESSTPTIIKVYNNKTSSAAPVPPEQSSTVTQDIASTGNNPTQPPLAQTACSMLLNGQDMCTENQATAVAGAVAVGVIAGVTAAVVTSVNNSANNQRQQEQKNTNTGLLAIINTQNAQNANNSASATPTCPPGQVFVPGVGCT